MYCVLCNVTVAYCRADYSRFHQQSSTIMERLFAQSRLLLRAPKLCRSIHRPVCQNKRALVPHFTAGVHRSVSSWGPSYAAVQLATQGKNLVMKTDGDEALLHPTWLRHNCQCPSCMSIEQKILDPSEINPSITVESAELSGDRLELVWSGGHRGYIEIDWLKRRRPNKQIDEDISAPKQAVSMNIHRALILKTLFATDRVTGFELYWTNGRQREAMAMVALNEYGMCLLTDFGTQSGDSRKLVKDTLYNAQPTVYGYDYDIKVHEKSITTAYTSLKLEFHMDQLYYESPPGLILMHCLEFDECVEGGESVMLDMFAVVEEMREKHPEHFNTLTRVPCTYQRIHYDREKPVHIKMQTPHIVLDNKDRVVQMRWSTTMEGALDVPFEDIQPYYDAHYCLNNMIDNADQKFYHRLKPGEVLTANNHRVIHARNEFNLNGGNRHLQSCNANIDHFKSAYRVVCRQLGKDIPMRRVFNLSST